MNLFIPVYYIFSSNKKYVFSRKYYKQIEFVFVWRKNEYSNAILLNSRRFFSYKSR